MSGHSKWSKIKRQKATGDIKRGQQFTKIGRTITLAVQEGKGIIDPSQNFKLRLAIEQAKTINMPKDTIDRAIKRGTGESDGQQQLQLILYEAYGPYGSAFLIEAATDNPQRTSAQVKHLLERGGGHLGTPGSVQFQFSHKGIIIVNATSISEEDLLSWVIESGATDIELIDNQYEISTEPEAIHSVKTILEQKGCQVLDADLYYEAKQELQIEIQDEKNKIIALYELIEELDDVQTVYMNIALV